MLRISLRIDCKSRGIYGFIVITARDESELIKKIERYVPCKSCVTVVLREKTEEELFN